jgi:glycogen debranching enzyme
MRFHDGTIATAPIAAAEVQGYAFDARIRMAELADEVWQDDGLAATLRREAADLQERFEERFTVHRDGGRFYALGLDHEGRQIDSLSSTIGHLLWSGIVPEERARECADQLTSPALFSGWGVRTMSSDDVAFNPIGYHTGTVWPHDTAIAVSGLMRYGFHSEAVRIGTAMLEAADYFDNRMPEVFAGYERATTPFPVSYPTACSPQAWSAGAPLLILAALLDLRPDRGRGGLRCERPATLPHPVELRGITALGDRYDIAADSESVVVSRCVGSA